MPAVPETFCFQANRESERRRPRPYFYQPRPTNEHSNSDLSLLPPSGKEKGYEAQPSGGVSAHFCITILTFTLLTRQTLYELRSGTVIRRLLRSWPARPGKGNAGIFPAHLTSRFIFSWHPFSLQLMHVFFDALIEPSLQTNCRLPYSVRSPLSNQNRVCARIGIKGNKRSYNQDKCQFFHKPP